MPKEETQREVGLWRVPEGMGGSTHPAINKLFKFCNSPVLKYKRKFADNQMAGFICNILVTNGGTLSLRSANAT